MEKSKHFESPEIKAELIPVKFKNPLPAPDSEYFADISEEEKKRIMEMFEGDLKMMEFRKKNPDLKMKAELTILDYFDIRYPTHWKDYFYAAKGLPRPEPMVTPPPAFIKKMFPTEVCAEDMIEAFRQNFYHKPQAPEFLQRLFENNDELKENDFETEENFANHLRTVMGNVKNGIKGIFINRNEKKKDNFDDQNQ
ncbi:MAG TPA: hypothetical protein PLQ36_02330 [Candidatus Gracilibacteria bacterium]|nr:hypothetical protein [Candidatus Gracilibacteria bacterium]